MKYQIHKANEFYVHTDNYYTINDIKLYGRYVLEKIGSSEMLSFVNDSKNGEMILKRVKY